MVCASGGDDCFEEGVKGLESLGFGYWSKGVSNQAKQAWFEGYYIFAFKDTFLRNLSCHSYCPTTH